jgi:hypothetical protein
MEQHAFKNVNKCLNANICSYLETSGGQSSNPYLNAVHFFSTPELIRNLWQLKTVVFPHWCLNALFYCSLHKKYITIKLKTTFNKTLNFSSFCCNKNIIVIFTILH